MIERSDQWGPFAPELEPAEYRARLRSLAAITKLMTGPRGADVVGLLRRAEGEPDALEPALHALNQLGSWDRRGVLASFSELHWPKQKRTRS